MEYESKRLKRYVTSYSTFTVKGGEFIPSISFSKHHVVMDGLTTLFMTLVVGLALAISISVFAEDVRSGQPLIGALIIPIIFPATILMFSDIGNLPTFN